MKRPVSLAELSGISLELGLGEIAKAGLSLILAWAYCRGR
jgi:hypothetical protein